jgi:glycosyltransferase involved in cell wall biosynthesis
MVSVITNGTRSSIRPLNLLFVNYGDFDGNGIIHIFHFANDLSQRGHRVVVAVPGSTEMVHKVGEPHFQPVTFSQILGSDKMFEDGRGPDLIHAWTPRENVRLFVEAVRKRYPCPYLVHLEDNEQEIIADNTSISYDVLRQMSLDELDRLVPDKLTHPIHGPTFLGDAAATTVIIDRLAEFARRDAPIDVLWPSFNPRFLELPLDGAQERVRAAFDIDSDELIVAYPGHVHASNVGEVRSLYLAMSILNQSRSKVRLIRCGIDTVDLFSSRKGDIYQHVIECGFRSHAFVREILSAADILVQPGRGDRFNNYRFPSKLPEFLASGKPVILPNTNIGRYLSDGTNCLLLQTGDAIDIADKIARLATSARLRESIGTAGRAFAVDQLSWSRGGDLLERMYTTALRQSLDVAAVVSNKAHASAKSNKKQRRTATRIVLQRDTTSASPSQRRQKRTPGVTISR